MRKKKKKKKEKEEKRKRIKKKRIKKKEKSELLVSCVHSLLKPSGRTSVTGVEEGEEGGASSERISIPHSLGKDCCSSSWTSSFLFFSASSCSFLSLI